MGEYSSSCPIDQNLQTITASSGNMGFYSSAAYFQFETTTAIYFSGSVDYLSMYTLVNGLLSSSPTHMPPTTFGFPGSTPSISANGQLNGIVWAIERLSHVQNFQAVLHAYNAGNLNEIYNTNMCPN